MAHWAELDANDVVLRVTVGDNNDPDEGHEWLIDNLGGRWIKTSYNGTIRKNFAGIGFTYDPVRDAFIAPQPFKSWILNEATCQWEAPVAYPADGLTYSWDEKTVSWQIIDFSKPAL
jgi:hypothetical protein